jgi:hypothetical protein
MERCYSDWFVWSAGAVLFVTGLAKIVSGFGQAVILVDPVLSISFGKLMLLVGAAEVAIAILCFTRWMHLWVKTSLVAWIGTGFFVYRLGL